MSEDRGKKTKNNNSEMSNIAVLYTKLVKSNKIDKAGNGWGWGGVTYGMKATGRNRRKKQQRFQTKQDSEQTLIHLFVRRLVLSVINFRKVEEHEAQTA